MSDKNMIENINLISKKTSIPTKKILDFLYTLSEGKAVDNLELVQKIGVSKNALNQIKEMLSPILKPASKNTQLKPGSVQQIKSLFGKDYKQEDALWSFLENKSFMQATETFRDVADKRLPPERQYDQFTATSKTVVRRAFLLKFFGDIESKRLLFLGDDDFTSVAIANLGSARSITVADIDRRILSEIGSISNDQNLGIKTVNFDARKKLPSKLKNSFDIVFTDPPYTTNGIKLFSSRAIESLDKNNKAARIYLCYGNSDKAKERFLPIHEILINSGLMIRWIFDKFNRYFGAESIGSASSLFIAEVTPKTKPLITGDHDKPIYTNN